MLQTQVSCISAFHHQGDASSSSLAEIAVIPMQIAEADVRGAWAAFSDREAQKADGRQAAQSNSSAAGGGWGEAPYLQRLPQLTRRLGAVVLDSVVSSTGADSPLLGGESFAAVNDLGMKGFRRCGKSFSDIRNGVFNMHFSH